MTHIIFDIGGVLIDYDLARMARELAARDGLDPQRFLSFFSPDAVRDVETGRLGPVEHFERTAAPLLPGMSYEGWVAAWMTNYSINEPGWSLLTEARARGKVVCLLSNLAPFNQLAIERKFPHFFRAAHQSFYSYELGLHKPDPAIYRAVCARLGVAADQCFFLDDLEENVAGAREAGMPGLRFANDRLPEIREALGLDAGAPLEAAGV